MSDGQHGADGSGRRAVDDPPTARENRSAAPEGRDEREELGGAYQDEIPTAYEESFRKVEPLTGYQDPYAQALARDASASIEVSGDLVEEEYPDAVSTVALGSRHLARALERPGEEPEADDEDGRPTAEHLPTEDDELGGSVDLPTERPVRPPPAETGSFGPESTDQDLQDEITGPSLEPGTYDVVSEDVVAERALSESAAFSRALVRDTARLEVGLEDPLDDYGADDEELDDGPTLTGHLADFESPDEPAPRARRSATPRPLPADAVPELVRGEGEDPDGGPTGEKSVDLSAWSSRELDDPEAYERTAVASFDQDGVAAPPFDPSIEIVHEEDPEEARRLSTQVSQRLRSPATSASSVRSGRAPSPRASEEHREIDPRPFLESLRRNPADRAALAALQRIYAANEQWEELVGLLLEASEAERAPARRLEHLVELAAVLAERLNEPDKAQVALVSALLLEPRSDLAAERLEEVTARAGLWNALFSELGQAAAQETHAGRRAALCARMGEWYMRAGHGAYAQPCFEQALAANAGELRALVGMVAVFEKAGDASGFSLALARLPAAPPPGASPDLLTRLANYHERRGDDRAAASSLDAVLEGDPGHAGALEALERVLGRQGRFADLAERLAARAEQVNVVDPDAAAELWRRVARLQVEQVGDLRTAEKACKAAIDLAGPDGTTLEVLESIYAQGSRWPELAWVLERQLELTSSSREKVALLCRLAEMDEQEFLKLEAAVERWERVLELEPRNEDAHERATALLRRLSRWPELVRALERRAAAAPDDPARARCFVEAAAVLQGELGDLERAGLHLKRARKLDPTAREPGLLLAEVLEGAGDHEGAYQAHLMNAQAAPSAPEQARSLARAAEIARDRLGRHDEALELLERAVAVDPTQREAAAQLHKARVAAEDWAGAARALEVELDQASGSAERARLLVELGGILGARLGRAADAIAVFEQARSMAGDLREAVAPLFDLYLEAGRPQEAAGLADALVRSGPRDDPDRQAEDAIRAGRALAEVGEPARGASLLRVALKAAPDHAEALAAFAELAERAELWAEAQAALARMADRLGPQAGVKLKVRVGRAARMCGDEAQASRWFEEVLEEDPDNNEARRQLAALAQRRGEPARALELLGEIQVTDPELRPGHLKRLVDLAREAGDDEQLVGLLRQLLELQPDDRRSLTMLLDALSREEDWQGAVQTIERLAASAGDDARARAKSLAAAAVILRDKLGDIEGAVAKYEAILDEDWTDLAVFESIDKMLTAAREYRLQEKVYRRMIHRVAGKGRPELEVQLWHALGEVYRSRLHRFEEAAEAFSAAARLEPDNQQRQVILAELYAAMGKPDEAVRRHRELLRLEPARLDSLRAIREAYSASADYDRAFAVVSALATRGQASEAELEFFEQWLPRPMVPAIAPLDDEAWIVQLRHEAEDPYVSGIFGAVLPFALAQRVRPARELGLGPQTAVDWTRSGGGLLAQQLVAAARILGVVVPQLHVVRDQASTMAYALTDPPASIMGGAMTQVGDVERVFLMGRHLAYYQGGRYMAVTYPSRAELVSVLLASVAAITGQDHAVPPPAKPFLDKLRGWLRQNPHVAERLATVVKRFLDRGGKVDIERWLRGVEHTACRAGLLLVADPRAAASALRLDGTSPANLSVRDRVEDLLGFVVGDAYVALRHALGVRIG